MWVTMNLWWVAAAAVLALLVALLVAWPFWRKRVGDEMGTIIGAFVVFACVILFIGRESGPQIRAEGCRSVTARMSRSG